MIDFKNDISNNISFPDDSRRVILLIDGKCYRLDILRNESYKRNFETGKRSFNSEKINYLLSLENTKEIIAEVELSLYTDNCYTFNHEALHNLGFEEVPDDFFLLEDIKVDNAYRGEIGTALLNYVISDINKFGKQCGKNFKILLQRLKSVVTKPFYKKFGARTNSHVEIDKIKNQEFKETMEKFEFMIIDEPKPISEIPLELADDFDYSAIGEKSPFTEPEKGY